MIAVFVSGAVYLALKPEPRVDATQINAAAAQAAELIRSSRSEAQASKVAETKGRTVAFIGDSYTAGTAGVDQSKLWPALLTTAQGWEIQNYAIGGTGYASGSIERGKPTYLEQVPKVVADGSGIVIVSGGRNDVQLWQQDPAGTAQHIEDTFTALRAGSAAVQIIAVNPWWDDDQAPPELEAIGDTVRNAVTAVGGSYLSTGQPLANHPELISDDGIHPNEAGHAALFQALIGLIDH